MSILGDIQLIGKALQEAGKIDLYQKLLAIQEKDLDPTFAIILGQAT